MYKRQLYHAFLEVIERSGTDFYLTNVGCFGACYQEPLVNVRVPGSPLLILHRIQANDAGRIVHDIATGTINPELVYCKIEELSLIHIYILHCISSHFFEPQPCSFRITNRHRRFFSARVFFSARG